MTRQGGSGPSGEILQIVTRLWSAVVGPMRVGWRILVSNRPRAIILAAGSVSIALAAASLATAAVTSHTIVQQTVAAGWRGAYDLLIRPADATTLSVNGKAVVPGDFLAVRSAGITRTQWQTIQEIPGVEVAAPLATLGWLRPDDSALWAELALPARGELIRIDASIETGDGTVQHDVGFFGIDYDHEFSPGHPMDVATSTIPAASWGGGTASVGLSTLVPMAWGDIVGVDPVEEDRLVGLDGVVSGVKLQRGLTTTFDMSYGVKAVRVPVITPSRVDLPGQVSMTVSQLSGVDVAAVAAALDADRSAHHDYDPARELAVVELIVGAAPAQVVGSDTRPLADLLQPLRSASVSFVDGALQRTETGGGLSSGRNALLRQSEIPYDVNQAGQPVLGEIGTWGELVQPAIVAAQPRGWRTPPSLDSSPLYRPLTVTVPEPFLVDALGSYDLAAIADRFAGAANYVPLGIFGDPARRLVADASGQPVDAALPISLNPGGLNPLPPIGLTNLETVEALRGERFIDAIRVRVADITGYGPDAIGRIEQVARAISERTGLHVDVVAGSSPVDVDIAVAGVGTVRERWTTLGEAPLIASGAEGLSGLLLAAAGLVVVLYLGSFGVFLVDDQRRGLEILGQIGWRRRDRVWLLVSQALLLGLAAALLSVGLLAVFDATTEVDLPVAVYPLAALAVVAAHMAAAGLAAVTGVVRREQAIREPGRWLSLGVVRLGIRGTLEAPRRTFAVALALALAILVAGTIAAVEAAYGGELRATVLGDLVWLRVGWYHLLAAGAALFAAASIALDGGVLAVERRIGLIALLRATGWRAREIAWLVAVEAGLPSLAGGLLASIPVTAIGLWVGLGLPVVAVLATASVALGAAVALVVAALPARLALAVDPARGLAAEGMTSALPGFASRAALATIVALALFVTGAGVGYGVLAPAAIPPEAFVPVPTPAPPSPEALALAAHVDAIAAHPDRSPGSASLDWTLGYVGDVLTAQGATVSDQAFVSSQPTWLDASGQALDVGAVFQLSVAVTPAVTPPLEAPFTAVEKPAGRCVTGVAVLPATGYEDAAVPFEYLMRCAGAGTTAAIAVVVHDPSGWDNVKRAATVRLAGGRILLATIGTPTVSTPLVIVPVASTGPGAAQSAAPIAVALELAAKADAEGLALRLAFADVDQGGMAAVLLRRVAVTMPGAPLIELGPLGGRLAAVLGVQDPNPFDPVGSRVSLLGSIVLDEGGPAWFERTANVAQADTSERLLADLAGGTAPSDVRLEGIVATSALPLGIDAAYLGEPTGQQIETGSPADTADQLDVSALELTLGRLGQTLEDLDGR